MPNYQNGKIYCLRSHQTDKIYIGSTTQKLSQRMTKHRNHYKYKKTPLNSYELMSYDDCYIELLENYPCNSKEELCKKEGEYIRKLNSTNKRIAGRTKKDYYNEHKEQLLEKFKENYQNNKEHRKKCSKEYYKNNKEKVSKLNKNWTEKNKEYVKMYRNEKIKCECGKYYTRRNKKRHEKSNLHFKLLKDN